MSRRAGRHFLQIPGPTNVPDRVLRAIDRATIDHRGPDFAKLGKRVLAGMQGMFQTKHPVIIYPASATGAWEAAMVNTLSPGDRVVMFETGQFAVLWRTLAERLGLEVDWIESDWRTGADAQDLTKRLEADASHAIRAVCIVHNDTATGITSNIEAVRQALDDAEHPALLMADTVSSLGAIEYRHDDWGVDVAVSGSQKGLMLPPGLSFNALSPKALKAYETARLPRAYWDWQSMLDANESGEFPYTPATNLLYGLDEALRLFEEEGFYNVLARHQRLAGAARLAVDAWGLEMQAVNTKERSNAVTAVRLPEGHDADAFRARVLDAFDLSLGNGLGPLKGQVFRIGHLGDFNALMLAGTLSGVEMGLRLTGIPHVAGGVDAALEYLADTTAEMGKGKGVR